MPKVETGVWKTISSKSIELAEIPSGIESEGDVEGGTSVVNSYRSDEGLFLARSVAIWASDLAVRLADLFALQ